MPEPACRILLVDDDLFFTARILSVLTRLGHSVETARSEREAIEKAGGNPDLVILNLASKAAGGLDLVRRLKSVTVAPKVVAFFSHKLMPEIRNDALAAGVDKLCANSAISMRLPEMLQEILGGEPPGRLSNAKAKQIPRNGGSE